MAAPARVVVLNPHHFYQPYVQERQVSERLGGTFHADGPPTDRLLAEATVLLSHSAPIDRAFIRKLPACRLIVSYSTGVDHIDVAAAEERGIVVRGIAGYCTRTWPSTPWPWCCRVRDDCTSSIARCAARAHGT